jgi:S-adenosylmethionine hydrolase
MAPIITLLTDFGTADGYVAQIKGVLLGLVADVALVDVTHDIPPQDIETARLVLERYWQRFPPGTVHFVVVDPGVGSPRAALAVSAGHHLFVGPDNGVLSPALLQPDARAVSLAVSAGASRTFHGRDVFAPAAAALAMGTPVGQLGSAYPSPCVRRTPEPIAGAAGEIRGEIISIDRFGNAITNLTGPRRGWTLWVGALRLPVVDTYTDVPPGDMLAMTESSGRIEIAVREGSAARRLGLTRGTVVVLRRSDSETVASHG